MPVFTMGLPAGTYPYEIDGSPFSGEVPTLTAGSIDQASPTVGDTLTVTGSNATAGATFQWQQSADGSTGWTNIADADGASLDTTGVVTGDYFVRRVTTDGAQTAATAAVQVAAAGATLPTYNSTLVGTTAGGETWTNGIPAAGSYIVKVGVLNNGTGERNLSLSGPNLTVTKLAEAGDFGQNDSTAAIFHVVASAASDLTLNTVNPIFLNKRVIIENANAASPNVRSATSGDDVSPVSATLSGLTEGDVVLAMIMDRNNTPSNFVWGDGLSGGGIRAEYFGDHGCAAAAAVATGASFTGSVSEASMASDRRHVLLLVAVEAL